MRLATIVHEDGLAVAVVDEGRYLPLDIEATGFDSVAGIAAAGADGFIRLRSWVGGQPTTAYMPFDEARLGPAVPDPGAIYTIGHNYRPAGPAEEPPPARPLVYGKASTSVAGHDATLVWDRSLSPNVDPEVELGIVIGADGRPFGYTIINDVSSRDAWLDGDQWLLGKSMPGFCPVGPVVVTADELDPTDLRLGCTINGIPIQDGRSSEMRTSIPDLIDFLGRHLTLRPGDLVATGTPERSSGPLGPDRHLEPGDIVTVWIKGIGELTTRIA